MKKAKTTKQMERHFKGMANHYRISILLLIAAQKNINLEDIITNIKANEKTVGEHTRILHQSGLINKQYHGRFVEHYLSPYGQAFVDFIKLFRDS